MLAIAAGQISASAAPTAVPPQDLPSTLQLPAAPVPTKPTAPVQPPPPPAAGTSSRGAGPTLATVQKRGRLRCGSSAALPGFGQIDSKGQWTGFDVDFCRAVAAAVFGDASKVDFVPLTAKERFAALHNGKVDLISRDTTWTLSREASNDILFAGVDFFDGQGFMVRRSLGATKVTDLASKTICVQQDTTTELNLTDFFRGRGLKYEGRAFATAEEVETAYRTGACNAYTTDASALAVLRASLPDPDNNVILPQIIAKEPLGPAVRQGDDDWFLLVRWTLTIMIDAEELGIDQQNVDAMARGDNPRIKRLLGIEGNFGESLGLMADWSYRVIKLVGNYNDVFQRNLGTGSPLKIKRGPNELWTRGGLLYAPPVQ